MPQKNILAEMFSFRSTGTDINASQVSYVAYVHYEWIACDSLRISFLKKAMPAMAPILIVDRLRIELGYKFKPYCTRNM